MTPEQFTKSVTELASAMGQGRNTKQRTEHLKALAREIVKVNNPDYSNIVPILPLAKQLMAAGDCKIDAAKRHIAKAIRNLRYHWLVDTGQIVEPPEEAKHGGRRQNQTGRPRKTTIDQKEKQS